MTVLVQGLTVRFRRTIQVTQYEPAEAEVTFHAVAPEGESADVLKDTATLLKIASEEVHESLGLPRNTKMPARPKATGTKREAGSEIPGSIATHGSTRSEGGKGSTVVVPADDIPEAQAPVAVTLASKAAPAAPAGTGDAAKDKAIGNLSAWIGDFVKGSTITAAEIKTIYPKYSIASVNNLRPEQKEPFYEDVLKLLKQKEEAASL